MDWLDKREDYRLKYQQLKPIAEKYNNRIFELPGCGKLPATVYEGSSGRAIASAYRLTFLQRVKFLFSGKIYVSVLGLGHPPLAVGIGNLFWGKK